MAHIILSGATGSAGSAILAYAVKSPAIARVSVLSRRPVKLAENEPKAQVIIHKDFNNYPPDILDQLKGATGCIWAQGISSIGMGEDEYTKITVDYPVAAAKAFAELGDQMNFVYMSGEGASSEEKSMQMFGRIKGRAENTILALSKEHPSLNVYNIRPGAINPQGNYLAERKTTVHDRASTWIGGILGIVWKGMVIPTEQLARVCIDLATGDGKPIAAGQGVESDGRLLRNTALRRLSGM
jgi:hypothetical protein